MFCKKSSLLIVSYFGSQEAVLKSTLADHDEITKVFQFQIISLLRISTLKPAAVLVLTGQNNYLIEDCLSISRFTIAVVFQKKNCQYNNLRKEVYWAVEKVPHIVI